MFLSPSVIDGHGEADGAPLWVQDKKLVEEEPRTMCTSSAPLTGIDQNAHYSSRQCVSSRNVIVPPSTKRCFSAVLCILAAIRKHPEPHPSSGERREAPRRLHAVLQRSRLHQEDRNREGGEEAILRELECFRTLFWVGQITSNLSVCLNYILTVEFYQILLNT